MIRIIAEKELKMLIYNNFLYTTQYILQCETQTWIWPAMITCLYGGYIRKNW